MDTGQYLAVRKLFQEVIQEEVGKYFRGEESKITFFNNMKGTMIIANNYELVGDGDGSNNAIASFFNENIFHQAPTFIIPGDNIGESVFWLYLEYPDYKDRDRSYFSKYVDDVESYTLRGEEMLKNEEFKSIIMQMITDIAPDRLAEVLA